jgi:hypothetical protein
VTGMDPNVPPPFPPDVPAMARRPGNGMAIAALVLGIVSLALFCVLYVSLPCGILAIVFGIVGRSRARAGASGGGMATAGLVCGVIGVALFVLMLGLMCAGVSILGGEGMTQWQQIIEEAARQAEQGGATSSAPAP